MQRLRPLCPGDRVAICAPSGAPPRDAFEAGRAILAQRYDVVDCGGIRAGISDDAARLDALGRAWRDETVLAIFCARGGYGLLRIAQDIPTGPAPLVVGFSDITVLHAVLWQRGCRSIHGPVVTQLPRLSEEDHAQLFALLENALPPSPIEGLREIAKGVAVGPLVGGNLTVLSHLSGTPFMPSFVGAILLLEDVNEEPYRIDRALTHLLLSGAFLGLSGIVCGEFTDCGVAADVESVLAERLSSLRIPLATGMPVGHGTRNRALPHGASALLDTRSGTLSFAEGALGERGKANH